MPKPTISLVLLILLVAACAGPTTPGVELPRVGDEGGIIEGPDGVAVAVPPGATDGSDYGVELRVAEPPPDEVLDEGEGFVGSIFLIRASDAFEAQSAEPIVVRVPLPAGVTATDGGYELAVRAPREAYTSGANPFWHVMPAQPDESGTALLLPLTGLPAEALEVAVVTTPAPLQVVAAEHASVQPLRSWSDDVHVVLKNASLFGSAAEQQRVSNLVRGFALDAIEGYRELGFDPPVWQTQWFGSDYVLNVQHETKGICADPRGILGTYQNLGAIMYVCYFRDQEDTTRYTVYHEAFHAVQNAYLDFAGNRGQRSAWFIEGTAALAERSMATGDVIRTPDQYPDTGDGFEKGGDGEYSFPYSLQDMWAFLLRSSGLRFADVIAVMKEDKEVTTASAHRALSRTKAYADRFPTFEAAYWAYARNQAWERTQKLGDAGQSISHKGRKVIFDDQPPCSPVDADGFWPLPLAYNLADEAFWTGESSFSHTLEPYSFASFQLEVPDWATASELTRLTVTLKSDGRVIDHRDGARGTIYFGSTCHGAARSVLTVHPWHLDSLPLVVLFANTDGTTAKEFELSVEVEELEAANATGVWAGSYRSDVYLQYGVFGLMCAEVLQTGETLTGTFHQRFDDGDHTYPIEGTVEADRVTFGTLGADAIWFSGWLGNDGTYMVGEYTTDMADEGGWAAVKTDATSCETVAQPWYGFNAALGTFHDDRFGSVGAVYVTVWDFQPTKPIYPISYSFTGPAGWNDGRPWAVSYPPNHGFSGPWWLWGSSSLELANGTFVARPSVPYFPDAAPRSRVVDVTRVLPAPRGLYARRADTGDTVTFGWDAVPGATSYQANLMYYRNGEFFHRRYFVTQQREHTLTVPRSTDSVTYTYAVYVNAFSEHFGDHTLSGNQFNASRSITIPVQGAEPPVTLNAGVWNADGDAFRDADPASAMPAD